MTIPTYSKEARCQRPQLSLYTLGPYHCRCWNTIRDFLAVDLYAHPDEEVTKGLIVDIACPSQFSISRISEARSFACKANEVKPEGYP